MYSLKVRESVDKIFRKLKKRDKVQLEYIDKKIKEIRKNPHHFKPLRKPMQNMRRVHIGNFVLIFSIDEKSKTIMVEDYAHHDFAYII